MKTPPEGAAPPGSIGRTAQYATDSIKPGRSSDALSALEAATTRREQRGRPCTQ